MDAEFCLVLLYLFGEGLLLVFITHWRNCNITNIDYNMVMIPKYNFAKWLLYTMRHLLTNTNFGW